MAAKEQAVEIMEQLGEDPGYHERRRAVEAALAARYGVSPLIEALVGACVRSAVDRAVEEEWEARHQPEDERLLVVRETIALTHGSAVEGQWGLLRRLLSDERPVRELSAYVWRAATEAAAEAAALAAEIAQEEEALAAVGAGAPE